MRSVGVIILLAWSINASFGQKNEDWYNYDSKEDGQIGVSVQKAKELYKDRTTHEVIVAIIDSGVDIAHEDLKENIWVNSDEIPGNGIDDDGNGYIDDIHGWNFLGGSDGNINLALYETTRIYRKLKGKYDGKAKADVSALDQEEYALYLETKEETEKKLKSSRKELGELRDFLHQLDIIKLILNPSLNGKDFNEENINAIVSEDERTLAAKAAMVDLFSRDFDAAELETYVKSIDDRIKYHYNIDFDPRKLVGDDENDPFEKNYGNNDVNGGHADHGTHVAGIVGAVADNNLGIKGIAQQVKIMVLRAVPDGDERDKDVANAIIYAVDNGARVVNMSFGKGHSPNKAAVDAAIQYAEKNNVLLVHAAGNASLNIDETDQFPMKFFGEKERSSAVSNWINVGASGRKKGADLTAEFSNYGKNNVDIFAPGVDVYSTVPDGKYKENSGTSMAAPVVTGVAALILNYYPELTAVELKEVLLKSAYRKLGKVKVYIPGKKEEKKKIKFRALSKTGGIVNAYNALKYADKIYKSKLVSVK